MSDFYEDWNETKSTIVGLYPKWNLTVEQAKAFREEFQSMKQDVLREAVKRLWLEDKFSNTSLNPGKLKAMYHKVRSENERAAAGPSDASETEYPWEEAEIAESHEALLRRLLLAPVTSVRSAAATIRSGIGRWGWIRPKKSGGDNPIEWSAMMRSAVMYEMENPSKEAGDATTQRDTGTEQRSPKSLDYAEGSTS